MRTAGVTDSAEGTLPDRVRLGQEREWTGEDY